MVDRALLRQLVQLTPSQPATALWRAIEVGHLLDSGALPSDGAWLDLGCGDGSVMLVVRGRTRAGGTLVGLDPDPREVEIARTRGLYDRLEIAPGDAIPDTDGSFDVVISNSVLEHVDSLEPALIEVGRVLKREGAFVLTVPSVDFHRNLGSPTWLGSWVTGERSEAGYRRAIDSRLYHLRYWDLGVWGDALARAGLRITHSSTYMSRRETRRWATLSNATAGVLIRLIGGGRAQPIDVQRRIGVRGGRAPWWLRIVGRALAEVGAWGLGRTDDHVDHGSCLLLVAKKVGS